MHPGTTQRRRILLILLAPLLASIVLLVWIDRFGTGTSPSRADCIIVLGCRLYGSVPSPFLRARLDEALRLYREGYAPYIVVSGGQGPGEDITEAEAMMRYLVENGVAEHSVIKEDRSTSTVTNLGFSLEKMQDRGLETGIVVSNYYHLARASVIAGRIGLEASYSGVRMPEYRSYEMYGLLREVPALVFSLVTIW